MKINPAALQAIREKDGSTQEGLAAKAGITRPHLNNIEKGRRGCSPTVLKRLAVALCVPMSALVADHEESA